MARAAPRNVVSDQQKHMVCAHAHVYEYIPNSTIIIETYDRRKKYGWYPDAAYRRNNSCHIRVEPRT